MRVGLVTPYSWSVPGGVNHHVENLAAELETRGHEVWIMAPVGVITPRRRAVESRRSRPAKRLIPMGAAVPIPTNGSRAYLNVSPRILVRMDRALRLRRFDVLHVHEPVTPSVAWTAVLMAASPVVGTFHAALDGSRAFDAIPPVSRMVMKRIDVRIAVSEAARKFPASRFPGEYRIIPNGVPVELFSPALRVAKVKGRILFIGRAEPRKGLGVLLRAFARLRRRLPHVSLVIVGSSRGQVLEIVRNGGVRPPDLASVECVGWVDDSQKVAQLGQAEVVCAPSLAAESFGIVLAEAMAAGVPVVASDLAGYRAVLRDGAAGRLVPPGDSDALADALALLLGDAAERRRLAAAGLDAAADLSWGRVTDEIIAAYEDALAVGDRPGYHGLPDRPWFGQAVFEYVAYGACGPGAVAAARYLDFLGWHREGSRGRRARRRPLRLADRPAAPVAGRFAVLNAVC